MAESRSKAPTTREKYVGNGSGLFVYSDMIPNIRNRTPATL